jgi:hypothetical protein
MSRSARALLHYLRHRRGAGGPPAITLPYSYRVADRSETSGGCVGTLPGFSVVSGTYDNPWIYDGSRTDANSFSPSGCSKLLEDNWDNSTGFIFTLPNGKAFPSNAPGIRMAHLFHTSTSNRGCGIQARNVTDAELSADPDSLTSYLQCFWQLNASPDNWDLYARYEDPNNTVYASASPGSNNSSLNRWTWLRLEWNITTGKITLALVRAQDAAVLESRQWDISAAGQTLGHVPNGLDNFAWYTWEVGGWLRWAGFWLGGLSDAWPTTTLPATTEDYA